MKLTPLVIVAMLSATSGAQTLTPTQADSLLSDGQASQVAGAIINQYETLRLREEMSFSHAGSNPLLRGIILSITEKGYRDIPSAFSEPADHTDLIDYIPAAAPLATAWALRAAGIESRSSLRRMATATGFSLVLAGGLTLGLNHIIDEPTPDESSAHGLPSGHAALAFTSATILSREYGHYSPWVTIGSYTCATASQALRLHHRRHWINDVLVGAGIGIVSTNLAYFLTDKIYGADGINPIRLRKSDLRRTIRFIDNPTGFRLVSGTEVGNRRTNLPVAWTSPDGGPTVESEAQIMTSASFVAGADLNWYLHPNFSVDAMLRAATSTAKVASIDGRSSVLDYPSGVNGSAAAAASPIYGGEQIGIYHADLAAHFSAAITPATRFGVRAIAGMRHTTSCTFTPLASDSPFSTIDLPGQTRFELGAGFDAELLSHRNYIIGTTAEYYHTFNAIMPNRFNFSSFWKVLF